MFFLGHSRPITNLQGHKIIGTGLPFKCNHQFVITFNMTTQQGTLINGHGEPIKRQMLYPFSARVTLLIGEFEVSFDKRMSY
tara:strand:+ start:52018 stop:52263 length:246 start_codon:yes stop_codon:yes gene_type:complete